jgi:predicted TIM-barrel fold metal-dependent hydrolase
MLDTTAPIDCDIHVALPATEVLFPFLAEHWRQYIRTSAFKGVGDTTYPRGVPTTARPDAFPAGGGLPGSDFALTRHQTLDAWSARLGILHCDYGVQAIHNPDLPAAMASALNDWLVANWLDKEPRFRASLVVPRAVDDAVREIERVGGHPGFVQVFLPVLSERPYGARSFWPLYAAALRHGLALAIQPGASAGQPPLPVGWPATYLEEYAGLAQVFQTQVVSLVAEGVFDRFPDLRVVLLEAGVTWLPSLCWRFDKDWKALRRETPWVRRPPSTYINEHVRWTIQPFDAPPEPDWLLSILEQLGSDDLLFFATDYPHRHFDTPELAIPPGIPEALRLKILAGNAAAFYGF